VPVLIRNYVNKDGIEPNKGVAISDTWNLTRRFIVYDTISGIKEVKDILNGGGIPNYVRWAD
jgi:hypothetical protein